MTDIFFRSLQASNKTQILTQMKQNGQTAMEKLEKNIRDSDAVVCVGPSSSPTKDTVVIDSKGIYNRYKFISPVGAISNGVIQLDQPDKSTLTPCDNYVAPFTNLQSLTNKNLLSGVSIRNGSFTRSQQAGFKDTVTIKFDLFPAVGVPSQISSQINPVTLTTTVVLR